MTTRQAAATIGCTIRQVRTLIRQGTLRAVRIPSDSNQFGYRYLVEDSDVMAYRDKPQVKGFPRGQTRSDSPRVVPFHRS